MSLTITGSYYLTQWELQENQSLSDCKKKTHKILQFYFYLLNRQIWILHHPHELLQFPNKPYYIWPLEIFTSLFLWTIFFLASGIANLYIFLRIIQMFFSKVCTLFSLTPAERKTRPLLCWLLCSHVVHNGAVS